MNNRLYKYFLLLLLAFPAKWISGQDFSQPELDMLRSKEDSLKDFSHNMVFSQEAADRFRSDSLFIRTLVRALKIPYSFHYPFDSLNVSHLYSPDSAFRIFTWQLKKDAYVYLQKGAIQMNTPDGSLKLFPLFDYSMFTGNPIDSVRSRTNWIGAIYYRIIQKEHNGKQYYTLLGFDDFSIGSNKKWMEVLHFNEQGEPVFGGKFFSFKNDTVKRADQVRFSIEYKKDARTTFNYDPAKDIVVFDQLVSETNEPERKSTYIPVGQYEAFQWQNGQWVHIPKLDFNFRLKDGEFPRDATIYDDAGNVNEKVLEEASRRNIEKSGSSSNQPPAKQNDPPKKKSGGN